MTIALIVPIFNVEKYIKECLDSIVAQTVPFNEIILIDDGSIDNSYYICKRYTDIFTNMILIHQDNQGQGKARNVGLEIAQSDYIMFCDADDYFDLHTCEEMHKRLEKRDIEVGLFDAFCVYEDGYQGGVNPYDRSWIFYGNVMMGKEYFVTTYPKMHVVSPCLMVIKRDFLKKYFIKFPTGVYYEDNVFFIKIILNVNKLIYIPEKLYYRRYREGSTMNSPVSNKKIVDKIKIIGQVQEVLLNVILKRDIDLLIYLSYYWNLYGDFLVECSANKDFPDRQYWGSIIYERYKESRRLLSDMQLVGESLSIISEHCLILNCLKNMGIQIDIKEYKSIRERYKKSIINVLKKLPLHDENIVIGIYGVGKHTDNLMEVYEKFVGKIRCGIVYMETKVGEVKEYKNQPIYCMKDIIKDLTLVIISSFLYQDRMIRNIEDLGMKLEILTLYDKNESREINWNLLIEE